MKLLRLQPQSLLFDVSCSRGTYIRTLCCELAEALGTVGHMSFLVRVSVGPYHLNETFTLEECAALQAANKLAQAILPIDSALGQLPPLIVSAENAAKIKNGRAVKLVDLPPTGTIMRVYGPDNNFLAVARIENNVLQPRKVFHSR